MYRLVNQFGLAIALCFVLLIYLLLPSNNLSSDSYGYAIGIKNGQDLYSAHHLIYNGFYYYLCLPFRTVFPNIDVLQLCTIINTLFAVASLFVFARILKLLKVEPVQVFLWLLFSAFSFGIWRFSLENESYIISMFLSLLGSYFLLKYADNKKTLNILASGFFTMLAVLFHQIHFFWWLGLLMAVVLHFRSLKSFVWYVIPAFLVPIAYILVYLKTQAAPLSIQTLWEYLLHDYYRGNAGQIAPFKQHLMFIGVAVVRTFAQVYPYMLVLLKQHWVYFLPILVLAVWSIYCIVFIIKKKKIGSKKSSFQDKKWFLRAHLFILLLHLAFAFYSNGNAEFMVMTPILLGLLVAPKWNISIPLFAGLTFTILFWNTLYGAFPMYKYNLINQSERVEYLKANQEAKFISFTNLIQNQNEYMGGSNANFYTDEQMTPELLSQWIDSGYSVITDMPDDHKIISRGTFFEKNLNDEVWSRYQLEPVQGTKTLYGDLHLYKVHSKTKE